MKQMHNDCDYNYCFEQFLSSYLLRSYNLVYIYIIILKHTPKLNQISIAIMLIIK